MISSSNDTATSSHLQTLSRFVVRQIKFPGLLRGFTESLLFCGVFLAAGYVSLGFSVIDMLVPMVPVVFIMMLAMAFSGVYRPEITNSMMNLYLHSLYGFALGAVTFVACAHFIAPDFATLKFEFFFLFFSFFVINTMRPIISGTDFKDGGGRRTN